MKSLHPAVIGSNSSAAKSNSTLVMFDIVSLSLSPRKGDKPDTLEKNNKEELRMVEIKLLFQ